MEPQEFDELGRRMDATCDRIIARMDAMILELEECTRRARWHWARLNAIFDRLDAQARESRECLARIEASMAAADARKPAWPLA